MIAPLPKPNSLISPSMRIIVTTSLFVGACILRVLAEDAASTPQTANLEFVVPPDRIIKEEVHEQGGRGRWCAKSNLSPFPSPSSPLSRRSQSTPPARQQFQERIAAAKEVILVNVGATVYRSITAPVRSLVRVSVPNSQPVELWSSADFGLLSSLTEFTGNDTKKRRAMMMWPSGPAEHIMRRSSLNSRLEPQPL